MPCMACGTRGGNRNHFAGKPGSVRCVAAGHEVLVGVETRGQEVELLARRYATPFGIPRHWAAARSSRTRAIPRWPTRRRTLALPLSSARIRSSRSKKWPGAIRAGGLRLSNSARTEVELGCCDAPALAGIGPRMHLCEAEESSYRQFGTVARTRAVLSTGCRYCPT